MQPGKAAAPVSTPNASGGRPTNPSPPVGRRALFAILALGATLRLVGFASFPLWEDELYSITESTNLFNPPFGGAVAARPLYFLLQHLFSLVLPQTPAGLRLAPFLFGLAGIWVTWMIGARLFGATAGWAAALLLAIAPWHIYMSQMARYVSLLYLLAALSFFALLNGYRTDRPRDYGLALLALLAGVLTHPTFGLPVVGVALASTLVTADGRLGWRWPSRNAWRYLWGPFLVTVAAGYGMLIPGGAFQEAAGAESRSALGTFRFLPAVVQMLTPTVVAAGGVGGLLLALSGSQPSSRLWGMMTLLGCLGACLLLLIGTTVVRFHALHSTPMHPLLFVSAGALIQLGSNRMPTARRVFSLAAAAVLAVGVLPSTVSHLIDGSRFDYRPAFQDIRATAPQLAVLTWPLVEQRYYAPDLKGLALPEDATTTVLDSMLTASNEFWVVASIRRYGLAFDDAGERARWLASHCRLKTRHERPRLDYQVFRVELHLCGQDKTVRFGLSR